MMTPNPGLSDLVHDLRATLEAIGEGLVNGLPEPLLDAEPRLAEITTRLTAAVREGGHPPDRRDLLATRAALERCQHLGATIRSLGEVYASAGAGYDRSGRQHGPDANGSLQARG